MRPRNDGREQPDDGPFVNMTNTVLQAQKKKPLAGKYPGALVLLNYFGLRYWRQADGPALILTSVKKALTAVRENENVQP
jgi:hypothetical protein